MSEKHLAHRSGSLLNQTNSPIASQRLWNVILIKAKTLAPRGSQLHFSLQMVLPPIISCSAWNTRKPLGFSCFRITDLVATMTNSEKGDYSMPSSQRMESAPQFVICASNTHIWTGYKEITELPPINDSRRPRRLYRKIPRRNRTEI